MATLAICQVVCLVVVAVYSVCVSTCVLVPPCILSLPPPSCPVFLLTPLYFSGCYSSWVDDDDKEERERETGEMSVRELYVKVSEDRRDDGELLYY